MRHILCNVSLPSLSILRNQRGQSLCRMTKQGVRVALGYPAARRTLSLEDNVWIYWHNRFQTVAVEFDPSGKVTQIR